MAVYYGLICIWGIFAAVRSILQDQGYVLSKKSELILMSIPLVLVMALRADTVGTDIMQYHYHFTQLAPQMSWQDVWNNSEKGYWALIKLFNDVGISWRAFFISYNAFVAITFSVFFSKFSVNSFFTFFLHLTYGLFSMSMSGVRQTFAITFGLIAYMLFRNKHYIRSTLLCVLAYLFHNSGVILLLLLPVTLIKDNKNIRTLFLIFTFVTIIFRVPITEIVGKYLPASYQDMDVFEGQYVNPLVVLIALLIPLACYLCWSQADHTAWDHTFFLESCVYAAFFVLSISSNPFQRVGFYFLPFLCVMLANTVCSLRDRTTRIFAMMLCLVLPGYMFVKASRGGTYSIDEYSVFF